MNKLLIAALAALAAGTARANARTFPQPVSFNCEYRGLDEYIRRQMMTLPSGAVDGQTEQQNDGGDIIAEPISARYELRGTTVYFFVVEKNKVRRDIFQMEFRADREWVAKLKPPFSTTPLDIKCEADK